MSGMRSLDPTLLRLANTQAGVLTTTSLAAAGFRRRDIDLRVRRGEWQWLTPNVVLIQATPPPRVARLTAAGLHYGHCILGGSSALEMCGLPEPLDGRIHLVGPHAGRLAPLSGAVLHSAKDLPAPTRDETRVDPVRAVVQALTWGSSRRSSIFQALWAIQRGLVSFEAVQSAVREVKRSPGSAELRKRFAAIEPGVHSMPEYEFAALCRKRGLPSPQRQRQRRDASGRTRYTDVEWTVGGRSLVVEIDGRGHLDAAVQLDDQRRANDLALQGAVVIRVPGLALRIDPEPYLLQVERALRSLQRGERGVA